MMGFVFTMMDLLLAVMNFVSKLINFEAGLHSKLWNMYGATGEYDMREKRYTFRETILLH